MQCLYCKKKLGLFASKKRQFCSQQHEVAYHDEQSGLALRRVLDPLFTEPARKTPLQPAPQESAPAPEWQTPARPAQERIDAGRPPAPPPPPPVSPGPSMRRLPAPEPAVSESAVPEIAIPAAREAFLRQPRPDAWPGGPAEIRQSFEFSPPATPARLPEGPAVLIEDAVLTADQEGNEEPASEEVVTEPEGAISNRLHPAIVQEKPDWILPGPDIDQLRLEDPAEPLNFGTAVFKDFLSALSVSGDAVSGEAQAAEPTETEPEPALQENLAPNPGLRPEIADNGTERDRQLESALDPPGLVLRLPFVDLTPRQPSIRREAAALLDLALTDWRAPSDRRAETPGFGILEELPSAVRAPFYPSSDVPSPGLRQGSPGKLSPLVAKKWEAPRTDSTGSTDILELTPGAVRLSFHPRTVLTSPGLPQGSPGSLPPSVAKPLVPKEREATQTDSAGSTGILEGAPAAVRLSFRPRTGLPSPGLPQGSPPKLTPLVAQPLVSKEREAPRTDSAAWTEVPGFGMAPRLLYPQAGTHQLRNLGAAGDAVSRARLLSPVGLRQPESAAWTPARDGAAGVVDLSAPAYQPEIAPRYPEATAAPSGLALGCSPRLAQPAPAASKVAPGSSGLAELFEPSSPRESTLRYPEAGIAASALRPGPSPRLGQAEGARWMLTPPPPVSVTHLRAAASQIESTLVYPDADRTPANGWHTLPVVLRAGATGWSVAGADFRVSPAWSAPEFPLQFAVRFREADLTNWHFDVQDGSSTPAIPDWGAIPPMPTSRAGRLELEAAPRLPSVPGVYILGVADRELSGARPRLEPRATAPPLVRSKVRPGLREAPAKLRHPRPLTDSDRRPVTSSWQIAAWSAITPEGTLVGSPTGIIAGVLEERLPGWAGLSTPARMNWSGETPQAWDAVAPGKQPMTPEEERALLAVQSPIAPERAGLVPFPAPAVALPHAVQPDRRRRFRPSSLVAGLAGFQRARAISLIQIREPELRRSNPSDLPEARAGLAWRGVRPEAETRSPLGPPVPLRPGLRNPEWAA